MNKYSLKDTLRLFSDELHQPSDLVVKEFAKFSPALSLVYLETLVGNELLSRTVAKPLYDTIEKSITDINIDDIIQHQRILRVDYQEGMRLLLNGFALIIIDQEPYLYAFEVKAVLNAPISEAKTEKMLKGPRDAFVENYQLNIGLIRKRLKDPNLVIEELTIGRRGLSKLAIIYLLDVAHVDRVEEIRKRINKIDIDYFDNTNAIIEMISPRSLLALPSHLATERPDVAVESLLQGKIALMMENTPTVTIVPALISDFLKVPDDNYEAGVNAIMTRLIRLVAFFITLFIIPLYIAFTNFNFEVIPVELLVSIANQKAGLPLPNVLEVLLLLLLFEILRETDLRMSSAMGSALSIVGALIIGDAAVRAGIVSPIGVIVAALASISGLVFNRIETVNGLRWYRLFLIIMASTLGLFGLVIASLLVFFNLSKASFFAVPLVPSPEVLLGGSDPSSIMVGRKRWRLRRSRLQSDNLNRGDQK